MNFGGANIRDSVHCKCRFMGDDALRAGAPNLRPQGRFHVLAKWRNRGSCKPVNTARYSLEVLATFDLYEMQPRRARLRGCEIARLGFG